jgi:tetratricopeptide (TPR) repeat protein
MATFGLNSDAPVGTIAVTDSLPSSIASFPRAVTENLDPLHLNNTAVSLLQANRYDEALCVLEQALAAQSRTEKETHDQWMSRESCPLASAYWDAFLGALSAALFHDTGLPFVVSDASDPVVGVQDGDDLDSSPSNHFSLFNRPFLIDVNIAATKSTMARIRLVPAVLLFNMGLTFCRKALESVSSRDAYRRANGFFQLSLRILEENLIFGLYSADCSLLLLALYNNLGFISSHFFEDKDSMVCAGRLLATFVCADTPQLLSKDEYVFYYMNLLFLLNRSPIVAPAA